MRFAFRSFLNIIIFAGLVLALWPLGQTAFGLWNQRQLAAQFQQVQSKNQKAVPIHSRKAPKVTKVAGKARPNDASSSADSPVLVAQQTSARKKPARWPLTKLSIADIGLETFIVQGMDAAALRRGPGHDVNSSLAGAGNCVVAGHRNVYGSFFYRLDELLPGAPITLENSDGKFTYVVDSIFTTPDTNLTVLNQPASGTAPLLTLITCTLPHTNNRIILQARLSNE
ncbi:LPXTG-site transpeptidase (sortase) family protein [Abditibacterium utsteinense]|uniref:LPXTG-site transpeptidase (Sortase) family protein n=1 Tax=Abditibacterium utsteinense TaxID=1960156 RepID=A0A2S8SUY8_9BACT|nr:class D sortase [Abditibacterium utsteinense]PQV64602.1 LPXTG-site transpeptidase (sortase) family protein [Abditibacterium utsteinense]